MDLAVGAGLVHAGTDDIPALQIVKRHDNDSMQLLVDLCFFCFFFPTSLTSDSSMMQSLIVVAALSISSTNDLIIAEGVCPMQSTWGFDSFQCCSHIFWFSLAMIVGMKSPGGEETRFSKSSPSEREREKKSLPFCYTTVGSLV